MQKLLIKLFVLLLLTVLGQVIVAKYIIPSIPFLNFSLSGVGKIDTFLFRKNEYQMLYFGDSVIKAYSDADSDKRSIAEILESKLTSIKIGDMSSPSYHLQMFEALMVHISMLPNKPKAVVLPINLRSFAPLWNEQPEYEFKKEIFFLTKNPLLFYFAKPISIWNAIDFSPKSQDEFLKTPIVFNKKQIGTVGGYISDFTDGSSDEFIETSYRFFYLYNLEKDHKKLNALRHIISIAKEQHIQLYTYIVPTDYQDSRRYVGDGVTKQLTTNAALVCSVVEEGGFPCLNIVKLLSSEDFSHPGVPNEHLQASGREKVAKALQGFIRKYPF